MLNVPNPTVRITSAGVRLKRFYEAKAKLLRMAYLCDPQKTGDGPLTAAEEQELDDLFCRQHELMAIVEDKGKNTP